MKVLPRLRLTKQFLYMQCPVPASIPGHYTRNNALEEVPAPGSLISARHLQGRDNTEVSTAHPAHGGCGPKM